MNWTKASALAEIVSSVAILATLGYLAIQTQQVATQTEQNTSAIIANSRQQSLDAELQYLRMVLDYPVASFDVPAADGDDGVRQYVADGALVRTRENLWLQYQDGQLDADTWNAYLSVFVQELRRNRRFRETWDRTFENNPDQSGLDPGFVAAVTARLAD